MPRSKDTPCNGCGVLLWWNSRASKPKDQILCRQCRAKRRVRPCPCGGTVTSRNLNVERCSQACPDAVSRRMAGRARALGHGPLGGICITCSALVRGPVMFCPPCTDARRRDHYRRKNAKRDLAAVVGPGLPMNVLGERDGWRCHLCGMSVDRFLSGLHPGMPSYDHILPVSLGGTDEHANLALAHLRCNIKKGNRVPYTV